MYMIYNRNIRLQWIADLFYTAFAALLAQRRFATV